MSWIATGVAVGSAALGAHQQGQAQKQQGEANKAQMMANAAQMEYSPWTGMKADMMGPKAVGGSADVMGAAAQSGLQGYMFGKQFGDKKKVPEKKPTLYSGIDSSYTGGRTQSFDPSSIA